MAVSLISPSVTEYVGAGFLQSSCLSFSGAPDLCIKCLIRCPKTEYGVLVLVFVVGSLLLNFSLLKLWKVNPKGHGQTPGLLSP